MSVHKPDLPSDLRCYLLVLCQERTESDNIESTYVRESTLLSRGVYSDRYRIIKVQDIYMSNLLEASST